MRVEAAEVNESNPSRAETERPSRRCVTCGAVLEAEDFDLLWKRYTDHVVREHGKPAEAREVGP